MTKRSRASSSKLPAKLSPAGSALSCSPRLRVLAHRLVLHVPVAEADAEDEPPARDHIERGDLLGDLDRVVKREEETPRAERHAGGVGGDPPERRDRLEVGERGGEIVLARPHGGEADRARQ